VSSDGISSLGFFSDLDKFLIEQKPIYDTKFDSCIVTQHQSV